MANIPTVSWDETDPADSDARSSGDDEIREWKTQIREIMAVDHKFDSSGQDTTWGYHGTLTVLESASDPTAVADTIILYTKETSSKAETFVIDEDSNVQQLTSGGDWVAGMSDEIRLWSGTIANIPAGWNLCDGVSGRPNLVGAFVRGIATDSTEPGTNSGGDDAPVFLYASMPAHTHAVSSSGTHTHALFNFASGSTNQYTPVSTIYDVAWTSGRIGNSDGAHVHTVEATGAGASNPFENRPAYHELAYIVKS